MKVLIYYTGQNTYSAEGIRFTPGVNEVSLENWQFAQRNKLLVKRIDEGTLKIQSITEGYNKYGQKLPDFVPQQDQGAQEDLNPNYSLSGLNAQQASEIIGKTVNLDLLKSWGEQEERKGVSKLISERIAEIEKKLAPKKAAEASGDDDEDGDE